MALGLVQGVTELLPVSSSAHIGAVPRLLGWEVADWPPARRKELEVALHTGAALALAPLFWRLRPDAKTLALSLAPPVVIGGLFERAIEERLGGPTALAAGLVGGGVVMVVADAWADWSGPRREGQGWATQRATAWSALPRGARCGWGRGGEARARGLALGLAQAAALVPGVSRSGATLASARALGYSRAEASKLSFGVAGPVLVGATALKAWRGRRTADRRLLATGIAASFVGTRAALRLFGLERGPLWPFALERAALAGLVRYGRRP
ncbi:undecaprenyl-diphosphate phosphatase [Solirubrobacter sp. CPCC 204708]|uniref:Undecaprenyl-diphosphatase n=1 Tax=Solirubrobacter deserti TaxID=2282478 RepID=A0ABT4RN51_9ACTN|nr:undecaprenyl-diphosphate phosphatase [Solirubrobacter deserti]MBE2316889.1 undecaprenyl-diphosphate phosphatase [Solirubrobacter deserti]MDA0139720.1 undecaprenyl-diphosphate phosphatase [Solirubrobacter deserti]